MQRSTEMARRVVVDLGADVPNVLRRFSPPMSTASICLKSLVEEGVRRGIPEGCAVYHGEKRIEDDESLQRLVFPGSSSHSMAMDSSHYMVESSTSSITPAAAAAVPAAPLVITLRKPQNYLCESYHSITNSKVDDGWIIAQAEHANSPKEVENLRESTRTAHSQIDDSIINDDTIYAESSPPQPLFSTVVSACQRLTSTVHSELSETPTDISLPIDDENNLKFSDAREVKEGLFAVIGPKGPSVYENSEEFEKRFECILKEGLPPNVKVVVPLDLAGEYCRRLSEKNNVTMSNHTEAILKDWHKDCATVGKWVAGTLSAGWTWRNSMRIAGGPGVAGRTSVTRRIGGGFAAGSAFALAAWLAEGTITYALPRLTKLFSREHHAIIVTCLGGDSGIQLQSELVQSFSQGPDEDMIRSLHIEHA